MASWQSKALNTLLRLTVKPTLNHFSKKFLKTGDINAIFDVRRLMEKWPLFFSRQAKKCAQPLVVNGIPVVQICASRSYPTKTIVYLHGGAYVAGSARMYQEFAYYLAKACDAKIWLVEYRLAPEYHFPAALEDALAVYKALWEQHGQIVFGGDSSGGGLVLSTLIALRDKKLPLPAAAFCLSPWTDLALTGGSLRQNAQKDSMLPVPICQLYATGNEVYHPLASPLYADLSDLPPLLMFASSSEILLDDAKFFAAKAKAAGVKVDLQVWNDMPHIWPFFAKFLPEGRAAIEYIAKFVERLPIVINND